jgi:hypothetical protein
VSRICMCRLAPGWRAYAWVADQVKLAEADLP